MPIVYQIDGEKGVVVTLASGTLTDDDIVQLKEQLYADPAWKPGMKELADARMIERLEVTNGGIMRIVLLDQNHAAVLTSYRLAIVCSKDIVFGMARMYQMLTEQNLPNVRVFRGIEEARTWLGIE